MNFLQNLQSAKASSSRRRVAHPSADTESTLLRDAVETETTHEALKTARGLPSGASAQEEQP